MTYLEYSCDIRWAHVLELLISPFVDGTTREFVSVRPYIFDVVIASVVVEGDVFEVIGYGFTKKWMVLGELQQDSF